MKVLIGCEFTGIVWEAFTRLGHDCYSCDLIDSERSTKHIRGDILSVLSWLSWDMVIAFPPCTRLCSSGARWWKLHPGEQESAIALFLAIWFAPVPKIAIENPIGVMSTVFRKPDQIVQPWQFGHGETKATCLWLRGLPKLTPTNIVPGRVPAVHLMRPSQYRASDRSRTYPGIAAAMANIWGR